MIEKLVSKLIEYIQMEETVPDALIHQFTKELLITIRNNSSIEPSQSFYDLIDETDAYWRRVSKDQYPSEFVFNLGRVHSLTVILRELLFNYFNIPTTAELTELYKERHSLLTNLEKNPGIIHRDLASMSNLSESHLSQIMVKLQRDKLVYARKFARNKFYYLSKAGTQVLEKMAKMAEINPKKNNSDHAIIPYFYKPQERRFLPSRNKQIEKAIVKIEIRLLLSEDELEVMKAKVLDSINEIRELRPTLKRRPKNPEFRMISSADNEVFDDDTDTFVYIASEVMSNPKGV